MRFVMRPDWWNVHVWPGEYVALVVGTAVPMLMHPAELLAAAVWFSLVTWLMVHTRSDLGLHPRPRHDQSADGPLRGLGRRRSLGTALTACWLTTGAVTAQKELRSKQA